MKYSLSDILQIQQSLTIEQKNSIYKTLINTISHINSYDLRMNKTVMSKSTIKRNNIENVSVIYKPPTYLTRKYDNISENTKSMLKRSVPTTIIKNKPSTDHDKIIVSVKNIMTKLSTNNFNVLMEEFSKITIDDSNINDISTCVYNYFVDLEYLQKTYCKFIRYILNHNEMLYHTITDNILHCFYKKIIFTDKNKTERWCINNILLIGELYNNTLISETAINDIINTLYKGINDEDISHINETDVVLLCKLLITILPCHKDKKTYVIDKIYPKLINIKKISKSNKIIHFISDIYDILYEEE